ncbi:MAG: hypothetical protein ACI9Y1_002368 [Lentisphaeria bacterium]|jgi:hypothetical protein
MTAKVAVLVIHGMGSQVKAFTTQTINEINQRVKKNGKDPPDIAWKSVYWSDITEARQTKFMDDIVKHKDSDIDWIKLRYFVVSALGDAAA